MSTTTSATSSISTTIPASDSSTPIDSPTGIENPMSSLFFSSGSSSLIVAFLAIGLFTIVMCGIFGRRHLMRTQRDRPQPVVPRPSRKPFSLGKKPLLWDVWPDLGVWGNSPVEETGWKTMTPMAVILTLIPPPLGPPAEPPPLIKPVDPGGGGHALSRMLGCFISALQRFYFSNPPSTLPPQPPPPPPTSSFPPNDLDEKEVEPPASDASDEIEWGSVLSVRVSVIIAMPAERRDSGGTLGLGLGKDADTERVELGEFCIGMMDVPWSGDE